jgi:hypothetical protein
VPNNAQPCLVGSLPNNLHFALLLEWKNPFEFSKIGSPSIFASKAISHVLRKINIHDNHIGFFSLCYTCFKLVLWVKLVQCCNLIILLCLYVCCYFGVLPIWLPWMHFNGPIWTRLLFSFVLCLWWTSFVIIIDR